MSDSRPCTRVAILGIKALPAFAGADRVVEQLLDNFSSGNDYTIYLLRDGAPRATCTADRHYVYIPALKGKYLRAPSYFVLCCLHLLVKGRYDIVHVHNSDFGAFCPLLKLKQGVRVVGTFHGDPATRDKWPPLAKTLLRASEGIFVRVCDELTSVSSQKNVPSRQVHYIPNGLDARAAPCDFDACFPYEDLGLREGEYVMFACGRLDRTKGLHHLLDAYREIDTERRLLVVGDFTHDPGYSRQVISAAVRDERVVLHRTLLDRGTLTDVLSRCAVFVFPSEVEGMSMMLLEAVASGACVVASDIPENLDVVGANYPYLFRSGDSNALRVTLGRVVAGSTDRADVDLTRERIAARFCWEGIARAYEHIYAGEPIGALV